MPNPFRTFSRLAWAVALIGLLVLILFVVSLCSERDRAAKAKNEATMAEGRTTSAVEAINETGKLSDRGQATDAQVEDDQDAIRQAAPADRDRVARARLCRLQQRPDCDRVL